MSRIDELNWSADLRRIAWWLQTGNSQLAQKFINRGEKMYPKGRDTGGRDWKWWLSEINGNDQEKAAERALTWSVLLK